MGQPAHPLLWRISDGRKGHDSQSLGLTEALAEQNDLDCVHVSAPGTSACLTGFVTRRWPESLPPPDVVVGAGHATHLPMLLATRLFKARSVVLMRPSLPAVWFDYCLLPGHDRPLRHGNVITTRGVLNRLRAGATQRQDSGLILVGGTSRHYRETPDRLTDSIRDIVCSDPGVHWRLSDSPRTSTRVTTALGRIDGENLEFVHWRDCADNWISLALAQAAQTWVSEDSISMIFEALTAGSAVGLLPAGRVSHSRLHTAIDGLIEDGLVCTFLQWCKGTRPLAATTPLDEARRCAAELVRRGLLLRAAGS